MSRYKRTGRYVDPAVLRLAHANFNAALPDYEKTVDHFQTYSNNDTLRLERSSDSKLTGDYNLHHDPTDGEFTTAGGGTKESQSKLDSKGYPKSVQRTSVGTPEFKKWFGTSKV